MSDKLNRVFKAISDPTRREIFNVLAIAGTALSLTQVSGQFDISRQGITKHIEILKEAGLVEIKVSGREKYCLANPKPLKGIVNWVNHYDQFWDQTLNNLTHFLDEKKEG